MHLEEQLQVHVRRARDRMPEEYVAHSYNERKRLADINISAISAIKAISKNIVSTNRKLKIHTILFVSTRIIITSNCTVNFNCIDHDLDIPEQHLKRFNHHLIEPIEHLS
ncbi:hypothetical protein ALC56_05639 [Trachymyrmex septentrionalis]|uniref:Uncharacterized protein n=1 Tax=Trachymyrmex septentrionalis TaxID=34720 RepID=A0A195FHL6_9HYME|nr:PREDICTED: uncharacterized protein LOC108748040 [Trachymyrmex septentrionalis]KYN39871.1 hypothetical protein ALC56_05639 [Trachymyrmex septentrionalis]